MEVLTAGACEHCGSDPIFHRMAYYTILIDDTMRSVLDPGFVGRWFRGLSDLLERYVTPHLLEFMMDRGLARRLTRPDEDTQLLALMLWQEADSRGIVVNEFRLFDLPRNMFVARLPSGRLISYEGIPLPPGASARVPWLDNKATMKQEFTKLGLPVARGGVASSWRAALKIFSRLTVPVIVKPYSGSGSRHTLLHITNKEELKHAFGVARQVCPAAVIEEELTGDVYRATVVDGRLAATLRRDQPSVVGDGVSTIVELIEKANEHPARSGPYFHPVRLDEAAKQELEWQAMTTSSVPEKAQRVKLNQKINWSVGGTTADVSDEVHPDNRALFEEVARVLHAPIVGIDFIAKDIRKSWKDQERAGIIECNSMPFFDNHHLPFEGKPRNVAGLIWDMVLRSRSKIKKT